jgi:hypothetical protein
MTPTNRLLSGMEEGTGKVGAGIPLGGILAEPAGRRLANVLLIAAAVHVPSLAAV